MDNALTALVVIVWGGLVLVGPPFLLFWLIRRRKRRERMAREAAIVAATAPPPAPAPASNSNVVVASALPVIELDADEKAAIVAEWQRKNAEPPPTNPRPYGCLVFIVAGFLLLLGPGSALPQPWSTIVGAVLVLALVLGFFFGVFVGSGVYGRAFVRAKESLEWLVSHPDLADANASRQHAVSLIANLVVSDGPSMSVTLDIAEARAKLGATLQYVVAVERVLAEKKLAAIYFGAQ